jgi:mannan endo-1,4-beta-mannosidase
MHFLPPLLLFTSAVLAILVSNDSTTAPITRSGSNLLLNNIRWTASGANVYWLGLDENVIPPPNSGTPFYAPINASYPTKGRITEVMNTLKVMGARTIRSQTMGVSVGNPLSVMPELGRVNEGGFQSMDWAVREAGRHGLRIFVPLVGFVFDEEGNWRW